MHQIRRFYANLPPAWRWSLPVWLAARVGISSWGALLSAANLIHIEEKLQFYYEVTPINGRLAGALLGVWQRWDALHYQRIIESGYHSSVDLSAFFPLFPLLGKAVQLLTGMNTIPALLVVSSLAALLMLVVLYELIAEDFSEAAARSAVVVAVIFPSAFYFFAPYPQSLSLLLTLLAYRETRKERWLRAALAGLAAGLTHSTVIPLAILLGFQALLRLKPDRSAFTLKNALAFLPAAAPAAGLGLFLAWRAGQGFIPITELMQTIWQRVMQWPWVTAAAVVDCFATGRINTNFVVDLILIGFTITLAILSWKKIPWPQWLYQVSLLLYLVSTSSWGQPLTGYSRYMLVMFPVFTASALFIRGKALRLILTAISLAMLLLLSGVYFMWGWIA